MRKKVMTAAAAAALFAAGAHAKGRDAGPPDKRTVAPGEFDRIAVAGPFVVRVQTGQATAISLSGPRTMLDDTELVVRDGQLIIGWQEGASWSRNGDHGVDIDIMVPTLREAMMAGAGSIAIDRIGGDSFAARLLSSGGITIQELDAQQVRAQLAGSGSLAIDRIDAKTVEVDSVGAGGMRAIGRAGDATLRLTGSGSFDNPDFVVDHATIVLGGAGRIRAAVKTTADITAAGSGTIGLTGGAKCTISKLGPGEVVCN